MTLQRDLKRARIVLLAAAGRTTRSIAKEVGVQPLAGLIDKLRPGKERVYTKATDKRIGSSGLDKPPHRRCRTSRFNPLLRLELELFRLGTCQLEFYRLDTCRLASCRLELLQQRAVDEVGLLQRLRPRRQMSQFQRSVISTSQSPWLIEMRSSPNS